jgi:hypothetical protein
MGNTAVDALAARSRLAEVVRERAEAMAFPSLPYDSPSSRPTEAVPSRGRIGDRREGVAHAEPVNVIR